ncbi:MAG: hypothetical protein GY778_03005, partial [bacterium]|nr:hypothetical protein [bacterium]
MSYEKSRNFWTNPDPEHQEVIRRQHGWYITLNTHLHYHCCVGPAIRIDGVFALDEADGRPAGGGPAEGGSAETLRFHPAEPLDESAVRRLQELLRRRILGHFQRQGLLDAADVETMLGWGRGGWFSLDASAR